MPGRCMTSLFLAPISPRQRLLIDDQHSLTLEYKYNMFYDLHSPQNFFLTVIKYAQAPHLTKRTNYLETGSRIRWLHAN